MGPWNSKRDAMADATRFRNLVEWGTERRPRGPPPNSKRVVGVSASAATAAAAAAAAAPRDQRYRKRQKTLKRMDQRDKNMERQREFVAKREQWIKLLGDVIRKDQVHTLIRPHSKPWHGRK